ncbi:GntR family transcriptional regulator [Neptunicella marina]|uniref:GntR family transcriptional regulator n=1 Tax=Neptunicella marina TaxID=2125989 RepID=A0A8J6IWR6_9ALTE|nr:GntR family transcriptional regulator [Neptunicella marina]MBC3766916.1 GntR family transcriptional regulator [Neptunicella marina]
MHLVEQIKQDIQRGIWQPHQVLKQTELAEFYTVSRIPVRDAIARLRVEGWLVAHGKAGSAVAAFDCTEAEDLYLMRCELEPLILQMAAPFLTHTILGQARDILENVQSTHSASQVGELNWQFHQILYTSAQRPVMLETINQLHQKCGRYIGYQSVSLDYLQQSQQEHLQILALLQQKHYDAACQTLRQHIQQAGVSLVKFLNNSGATS